jgi:hypothetical protein
MKKKNYQDMTDDELAEERIKLDEQIAVLRAEKKKIQDEVDRRQSSPAGGDYVIANAGGIDSSEEVGG